MFAKTFPELVSKSFLKIDHLYSTYNILFCMFKSAWTSKMKNIMKMDMDIVFGLKTENVS